MEDYQLVWSVPRGWAVGRVLDAALFALCGVMIVVTSLPLWPEPSAVAWPIVVSTLCAALALWNLWRLVAVIRASRAERLLLSMDSGGIAVWSALGRRRSLRWDEVRWAEADVRLQEFTIYRQEGRPDLRDLRLPLALIDDERVLQLVLRRRPDLVRAKHL